MLIRGQPDFVSAKTPIIDHKPNSKGLTRDNFKENSLWYFYQSLSNSRWLSLSRAGDRAVNGGSIPCYVTKTLKFSRSQLYLNRSVFRTSVTEWVIISQASYEHKCLLVEYENKNIGNLIIIKVSLFPIPIFIVGARDDRFVQKVNNICLIFLLLPESTNMDNWQS